MTNTTAREVNFDGLIGPTHHYGGLASGNLASSRNAMRSSNPREAALQGLEKMRTLLRLGYTQGFLPPQQRPDLTVLQQLGFRGPDEHIINSTAAQAPELLSMVYSASSMWAANAATVTPSSDSHDGKVHFTPANLLTTAHRAIEHPHTERILRTVFSASHHPGDHFSVHSAVPSIQRFGDEGAANHTRLCHAYGEAGVGLFVYGRNEQTDPANLTFPARQTLAASAAVARQHGTRAAVYLQQASRAINAGAFHNDVVAVGNGPLLMYHQHAYETAAAEQAFKALREQLPLQTLCVADADVSLDDAIKSYLFNSQLLASPDGDMNRMRLIAPSECEENTAVRRWLEQITQDHNQPIRDVSFVDVRQSMSNGGGPACLRLRVVLTDEQLAAVNPAFLLDETKINQLQDWVKCHYRDQLSPADLADPLFYREVMTALEDLVRLLGPQQVNGLYPFMG
ncbi:N-succinylarginine dihydrolase [Oceanobacter mangrovi]|uniref:N-succinylarginine dihydrolase n=1 Tax=Oceanobacter mangrovi TaxID=2862510 RepID=UPI001C8D82F1|nr:N-succinylarginine dihydrolase [Oceanobacter mangrovi]